MKTIHRAATRVFLSLSIFACISLANCAARAAGAPAEKQWVSYEGKEGPGKGKSIVFVAGADEYNPESGLPILAHILADRYGFHCTVCFTINKAGQIDPKTTDNIPGLEALDTADLMVIQCRFRNPPDEQMKHIVNFLEAGKPVIGLRTATHSFKGIKGQYAKFNWDSKQPGFDGGFGRQVLGETWIRHHAPNGATSTRGVFAPGASSDPILRGISDGEIWGSTGVYGVRLPLLEGCKTLLLGEVIEGNKPDGKPLEYLPNKNPNAKEKANDPMQPVAWTRTYQIVPGKTGRAFTTTMGSAADLQNEALRRMMVNAAFWDLGMEDKIPAKADVDFVGSHMPWKKGMTPAQMQAE
ncbi:MAG TPA: hypothetical protein VFE47_28280 [Tepidisphaeraceae bacterium]|nr:hypothetical protein [Tepidisphaeraceae bacterium]